MTAKQLAKQIQSQFKEITSDPVEFRDELTIEIADAKQISVVCLFAKEHLDFDQIIWEFGDDNNPNWVHVSYVSEDENRGRALRAYKEKGKTKYIML